jgi:hypothetical protein
MWAVNQTAVFENWWDELSEQEQDDVTAVVEVGLKARSDARVAHPVPR